MPVTRRTRFLTGVSDLYSVIGCNDEAEWHAIRADVDLQAIVDKYKQLTDDK